MSHDTAGIRGVGYYLRIHAEVFHGAVCFVGFANQCEKAGGAFQVNHVSLSVEGAGEGLLVCFDSYAYLPAGDGDVICQGDGLTFVGLATVHRVAEGGQVGGSLDFFDEELSYCAFAGDVFHGLVGGEACQRGQVGGRGEVPGGIPIVPTVESATFSGSVGDEVAFRQVGAVFLSGFLLGPFAGDKGAGVVVGEGVAAAVVANDYSSRRLPCNTRIEGDAVLDRGAGAVATNDAAYAGAEVSVDVIDSSGCVASLDGAGVGVYLIVESGDATDTFNNSCGFNGNCGVAILDRTNVFSYDAAEVILGTFYRSFYKAVLNRSVAASCDGADIIFVAVYRRLHAEVLHGAGRYATLANLSEEAGGACEGNHVAAAVEGAEEVVAVTADAFRPVIDFEACRKFDGLVFVGLASVHRVAEGFQLRLRAYGGVGGSLRMRREGGAHAERRYHRH